MEIWLNGFVVRLIYSPLLQLSLYRRKLIFHHGGVTWGEN